VRRHARTLDECLGLGPTLVVRCQRCGRQKLFDCARIVAYFRERHWSLDLNHACQRFACRGAYGCGSKAAYLTPSSIALPSPPPPPPEPIMDERAVKAEIRRRRG
jgi:hypothetical protein